VGGIVGGLVSGLFDSSGPSEAEVQAQRAAEEKRRIEEEQRKAERARQEELRFAKLRGSLKGAGKAQLGLKTTSIAYITDWGSYKSAVLAHQQALTQKDPTHKAIEEWCKLHLPLDPSTSMSTYNADQWSKKCNADGAVAPFKPADSAQAAAPAQGAPAAGGLKLKLANQAPSPAVPAPSAASGSEPNPGGLHLKTGAPAPGAPGGLAMAPPEPAPPAAGDLRLKTGGAAGTAALPSPGPQNSPGTSVSPTAKNSAPPEDLEALSDKAGRVFDGRDKTAAGHFSASTDKLADQMGVERPAPPPDVVGVPVDAAGSPIPPPITPASQPAPAAAASPGAPSPTAVGGGFVPSLGRMPTPSPAAMEDGPVAAEGPDPSLAMAQQFLNEANNNLQNATDQPAPNPE
jgi:hypothetical protein